ncbi:MAG TPA: hypothetical protein VN699_20825 [Pirellulales bacterium]|nr:hypothetical protein [Pirellulales bacterium]
MAAATNAAAARFPWKTYLASLAVSAAAAALAAAIGGSIAAVLSLTDLPGRSFWATLMLLPFLAPSMVWTLGQTYCYGAGGLMERWCGDGLRPWLSQLDRGGFAGAALVLAEIHAPLALLLVGRGMAGLQQAGFESARLYLSPARLVCWTAGAVRQELAAAFLLSFALSLGNFTVPHVLQCRLYPIEIYLRLTNYLDHAGAVRSAAALLVPSLLAALLIAVVERNRCYGSAATASAMPPIELRSKAWLIGAVLGAYLLFTGVLPVSAMIYQCRSAGDFVAALRDAAPETENTLRIALGAAALAVLAGAAVSSWIAGRGAGIAKLAAEMLVVAPLGVGALVLGFAYAQFYNRAWPIDLARLGDTKGLIVIGLAARSWPFVTRALIAGRRREAPEWREAARLASLGRFARWRWIGGPLLFEHLAAGAVLAFVLAMGEVEISQLLCAPGDGTLALRLFTFLHFGPVHVAASLAVLQLALTALPVFAYWLFTDRSLQVV